MYDKGQGKDTASGLDESVILEQDKQDKQDLRWLRNPPLPWLAILCLRLLVCFTGPRSASDDIVNRFPIPHTRENKGRYLCMFSLLS